MLMFVTQRCHDVGLLPLPVGERGLSALVATPSTNTSAD